MRTYTHEQLVKPERAARKAAKKTSTRKFGRTRKQVCQLVFKLKKERCERCGVKVSFDVAAWKDERAQVNDIVPRSKGGDPLDVNNQELICRKCHFGGPSGAHAPTPARMARKLAS